MRCMECTLCPQDALFWFTELTPCQPDQTCLWLHFSTSCQFIQVSETPEAEVHALKKAGPSTPIIYSFSGQRTESGPQGPGPVLPSTASASPCGVEGNGWEHSALGTYWNAQQAAGPQKRVCWTSPASPLMHLPSFPSTWKNHNMNSSYQRPKWENKNRKKRSASWGSLDFSVASLPGVGWGCRQRQPRSLQRPHKSALQLLVRRGRAGGGTHLSSFWALGWQ